MDQGPMHSGPQGKSELYRRLTERVIVIVKWCCWHHFRSCFVVANMDTTITNTSCSRFTLDSSVRRVAMRNHSRLTVRRTEDEVDRVGEDGDGGTRPFESTQFHQQFDGLVFGVFL